MNTKATEQRTAGPARWALDRGQTSVEFAVKTFWGLSTVHGHFDRFDGWCKTGPDGTTIELTVDADSLDTGNSTRDKHLRSADFFDVPQHRQLRFTSSRVHEVAGGIFHVVGRLEVAGKTATLEFPATVRPDADGVEVEATTTLDQQELGMSSGTLGMIRRPVTLHVKARLSK